MAARELRPAFSSPELCLVTDRAWGEGSILLEKVDQAISGGVTMVQLREKAASARTDRQVYEEAQALRELCRERGVRFLVNDRLDLAMALRADGVHLGQGDLPVSVARALWQKTASGSPPVFGVSAGSLALALEGRAAGADYIGFGAVFPTDSKKDAKHAGIEELFLVVRGVALPVIAIGGIGVSNARRVADSSCAGFAVISAILGAESPRLAAAHLASVLQSRP